MKYTWENRNDGIVRVSDNGSTYAIPTVHSQHPSYPDYLRALRYLPIVRRHCGRVPENWGLAIIFAENSKEKDVSYAGAVGVMQVLPSTAKMSTLQLMNVEKNIEAGCRVLRSLAALPGADLVSVASMYNAGGQSNGRPHPGKGPFGFAESDGYIVRVLSASNEFLVRPPMQEAI